MQAAEPRRRARGQVGRLVERQIGNSNGEYQISGGSENHSTTPQTGRDIENDACTESGRPVERQY